MDRLFLDTNFLIDVIVPDRPGTAGARQIISMIGNGKAIGCACAGSLKDTYYVTRKHLNDETARSFIRSFMDLLTITDLDEATCRKALDSDEPDFEDVIIGVASRNSKADFIISRDAKAFRKASVPAMDAETYVKMVEGETVLLS